jgi:hypothetical protein
MAENVPTIETKAQLTAELFPEEGNGDVGYRVFEILKDVIQHKADLGLPAKWNRCYELSKNKHWKQKTKKATLVSANLLHAHRTRTVNMLTDNNPTFNIKQAGEADADKEEVFDTLLKTAEHWWHDQEQQIVLTKSVQNGETYGCVIEKVLFNSELENGMGEVEVENVDPYNFGVYPPKCMDIEKASAVFHYWAMPLRDARRRWPDKATEIQGDHELLAELNDDRMELQGGRSPLSGNYFSTFAGIVKNILNPAGAGKDADDEVLICEAWAKDKSTEGEFPKYPGFIRRIQVCNGGKVVLSDVPNPNIHPELLAEDREQAMQSYLFGRFPFSLTQSVTDTANPWGMTDFEQLEGLNIEVNKTLSQFTLVKDRTSRIKVINPKDSGVPNSQFTNAPGILNPSNALVAQGLRYLDPPKLPLDLIKALEIYREFFFLVAGSFEMEQAKTNNREVIAYKAIAALLERAATMLRGKIRNYSKMIRIRGRMYLSHVMNFYTEERWISYEEDGEEMTRAIRGRDMLVPAKLTVVSGSTMPVSKVQQREEALALFDKGAIDGQELLKKIEWPDWKDVVKRMQMGPVGAFLARLQVIGFPPMMVQEMGEIAEMDDKEFEKSLEQAEIPPFSAMLPQEGVEEEEPSGEEQKVMAEVEKVAAEILLIQEKINTEKVEQSVKIAGVEFDREKLAIERAKVVNDIKATEADIKLGAKQIASGGNGDKKKATGGKKPAAGNKTTTKSASKKEQGPHIEKGMKSNNQTSPGETKRS